MKLNVAHWHTWRAEKGEVKRDILCQSNKNGRTDLLVMGFVHCSVFKWDPCYTTNGILGIHSVLLAFFSILSQ